MCMAADIINPVVSRSTHLKCLLSTLDFAGYMIHYNFEFSLVPLASLCGH